MKRQPRRVRWLVVSLGVAAASALALTLGLPSGTFGSAPENDPALERTRAQAKMLDDLFKVAVVDITNRYDGPPVIKVAKATCSAS
jgi:hypothetical protein